MTFGEKLQALRRERGWSQEDLASEIPISRQAVSKWESSAAVPDTENVLRLSDIFGVSTDYLLREELTGDGDLPAVKRREAELREEKDRTVTMIVLVAVLALAFFWQVFGSLVYQNHLIVLLGMTAHIVTIVVFEAVYQRQSGTDGAKQWRRQFYQISVWLVALFPLSALTRAFWALYPRSHSAMAEWLSPFFLYLPLCLAVTMWLGKKRL